MSSTPTIRSLALELKLSVATVSEALRDSPRVKSETRTRVKAAAERLGYRTNPLLGATFSALRRSQSRTFFGTLALVDAAADNRDGLMPFHREVVRGAERRAAELGFNTELIWLGSSAMALSPARLQSVLHARNVPGIVFLPLSTVIDLSGFDFSKLAAVQMDNCLLRPRLHNIVPDHYLSLIHALERLAREGYRRIGVSIEQRKDTRLKQTWSSGYHAFVRAQGLTQAIPPLMETTPTREGFLTWFREHRPDVIVSHSQAVVDWLVAEGVRVPQDVGFLKINHTERTAPCAGLDLQPQQMGVVAVETVIGMIHRREQGIPARPITITLEAEWTDGPTLR